MDWKKDRIRPTQPYFVFDTVDFFQEVYLKQGISHFYTYKTTGNNVVRVVPDGCIDILFEFGQGKMHSYICGSPLLYKEDKRPPISDVFGVRFMPAVNPAITTATMKEVFDKRCCLIPFLKGDKDWLDKLENEKDFYQRIRIFLEAYTKVAKNEEKPYGKRELVNYIKEQAYDSNGRIQIQKLSEMTGYSTRYINKAFIEEMGFAPKIFCKIIQFQKALEFLNYGATDKMTDAAVELGYYDQPQFIRDFTKYAGITPKRYLDLVKLSNYREKVKEISL